MAIILGMVNQEEKCAGLYTGMSNDVEVPNDNGIIYHERKMQGLPLVPVVTVVP